MDIVQAYYPFFSWTAVVAIGIGAYVYYNPSRRPLQGKKRPSDQRAPGGNSRPLPAILVDDEESSTNAKKAPKPGKRATRASVTSDAGPTAATSSKEIAVDAADAAEDDAEWAARLADLRKGTKLESSGSTSKAARTVKQTTANRGADFSQNSSTTGADADDDMSPVMSPKYGAQASGPSGQDVSDMLEPASIGPSVLRVTESPNPQPTRTRKPNTQSAPAQESKKQRQNRKKAEERKAIQDQAEKERQVLLEKQRRQARETRGELAKDGSAFMRSAPATNAWAGRAPNAPSTGPVNGTQATSLLDTFEPHPPSPSSSTDLATSAASTSASGKNWERDLPSEEEQIRKIMEDDESMWNTVSSKKNRKKAPESTNGAGGTNGIEKSHEARSEPVVAAAAVPTTKLNGGYVPPKITPGKGHPDDSEWTVDA